MESFTEVHEIFMEAHGRSFMKFYVGPWQSMGCQPVGFLEYSMNIYGTFHGILWASFI